MLKHFNLLPIFSFPLSMKTIMFSRHIMREV